jgi:hypothetical protein
MAQGWAFLEAVRVSTMMQALSDKRVVPANLVFLGRTPIIPAEEDEIMGKFSGRVQIADIIADDAEAVIYTTGRMTFETTTVPNIKHGAALTQSQLNQLMKLKAANVNDGGLWTQWQGRIVDGLLLGIRQRMEALIVAMKLDGFSYDRLGVKMTNVTWGMPTELKVTPSTPWTDVASTPVADILNLIRLGQIKYGENWNRLTLGRPVFEAIIATTEFKTRATLFLPYTQSVNSLALASVEDMIPLLGKMLKITVELYDGRYWSSDNAGIYTSSPFLPLGQVILDDSNDDGDQSCCDFASAVVTESIITSLAPTSMIGRFAGPTRGPVAYYTARENLNPPNLTAWGVARGFPRKKRLACNATLSVGTFVDPVSSADVLIG